MNQLSVVTHAYNLNVQEAEAEGLRVYKPAWATQRDPVSKITKLNKSKQAILLKAP
jgi:hypothetical protein